MKREPVLPAGRAAVFTAVCLGLGVLAHRVMSGAAIPEWAVVLGGAGVYACARVGARRERGLAGIAVLMGVFQIALHLLFAYAQDAAAGAAVSASMPGMTMSAGASMPSISMPGVAATQPAAGMRMGVGMVLGHALVAMVCAWWLRRGEAALHALARNAVRWAVERLGMPVVRTHPVLVRARCVRRVAPFALALRSRRLFAGRLLRGPPASFAFA